MGWLRDLAGEAFLQLRANTIGSIATVLVTGGLVIGVGFASVDSVARIEHELDEQQTNGRFVYVVAARERESSAVINGSRCDNLAKNEGVIRAGALRREGNATTTAGQPVVTSAATFGLLDVLENRDVFVREIIEGAAATAVVGPDLALNSGVVSGSVISLATPTTTVRDAVSHLVSMVLSDSSRTLAVAGHLVGLVPNSSSDFNECWIEFEPRFSVAGREAVVGWFGTAEELGVYDLYSDGPTWVDLHDAFANRAAQRGWIGGGVTLSLFVALMIWVRRSSMALYLSLGLRRRELVFTVLVEYFLVLSLGASIGMAWLVLMTTPDSSAQLHSAVRSAVGVLAVGLITIAPAVLVVVRSSLANLLKDQN